MYLFASFVVKRQSVPSRFFQPISILIWLPNSTSRLCWTCNTLPRTHLHHRENVQKSLLGQKKAKELTLLHLRGLFRNFLSFTALFFICPARVKRLSKRQKRTAGVFRHTPTREIIQQQGPAKGLWLRLLSFWAAKTIAERPLSRALRPPVRPRNYRGTQHCTAGFCPGIRKMGESPLWRCNAAAPPQLVVIERKIPDAVAAA